MIRARRYLAAAKWHWIWFLGCVVLTVVCVILGAMATQNESGEELAVTVIAGILAFSAALHNAERCKHHINLYNQAIKR